MGKGNYASNIRKIGKSYETDLTKPNIEGQVWLRISKSSFQILHLQTHFKGETPQKERPQFHFLEAQSQDTNYYK